MKNAKKVKKNIKNVKKRVLLLKKRKIVIHFKDVDLIVKQTTNTGVPTDGQTVQQV